MDKIKTLDARYQTVAWGAVFLLVGILSIVPGNQSAACLLGIGIIFLGLNLARSGRGIPMNAFSITLGVLALGLGMVALLSSVLGWGVHFDLPVLPTMLVIIGLYLLIPGPKPMESC